MRMTAQRREILAALRATTSHPSADELFYVVRRRLPAISLGTVYRNLELLAARGLIQKLWGGAGQRRFDGDVSEHYHLRCIRCGRVEDAPLRRSAALEKALRGRTDFDVLGHTVEFFGYCPACRAAKPKGRERTKRKRK